MKTYIRFALLVMLVACTGGASAQEIDVESARIEGEGPVPQQSTQHIVRDENSRYIAIGKGVSRVDQYQDTVEITVALTGKGDTPETASKDYEQRFKEFEEFLTQKGLDIRTLNKYDLLTGNTRLADGNVQYTESRPVMFRLNRGQIVDFRQFHDRAKTFGQTITRWFVADQDDMRVDFLNAAIDAAHRNADKRASKEGFCRLLEYRDVDASPIIGRAPQRPQLPLPSDLPTQIAPGFQRIEMVVTIFGTYKYGGCKEEESKQ